MASIDRIACSRAATCNNQAEGAARSTPFKFPPPPRLCRSATGSSCCASDTDTGGSDGSLFVYKYNPPLQRSSCQQTRNRGRRRLSGYHSDSSIVAKPLPPIGVFWDIENCQVPKGRSAIAVAQLVRDLFFTGYREAEFIVVCDVKKETSQVVQELSDAQINLIHVASTNKNAADEKLRQCMRRFADIHRPPAAIILMSGDINFAADLSDLRHRKKIHVILIHKNNTSEALILCANEHHCFTEITNRLPQRQPANKRSVQGSPSIPSNTELHVSNLPLGSATKLRSRLRQLSDNCGGRVARINEDNGTAVMRFTTIDSAVRFDSNPDVTQLAIHNGNH